MKTRLLHAALFTPMNGGHWGLPLVLWGPPGIAKTAIIKLIGRMFKLHVEHLAPGERGEGAFGVTPVPKNHEKLGTVLSYPAPEWVTNLWTPTGDEAGIVFLDELNTAPPALQPALLGAIQERRIGGHQLGPRVRVLGAANPVDQAAGGWDIAPPVANRLGHIEVSVMDNNEWADALLSGFNADVETTDAEAEEKRVLKAFPEAYATAAGLVATFIRRRPELLHKMPNAGDPAQSRAWASPRSWEYAVRAKASAKVHSLSDVDADELLSAFVGNGAAGELASWVAEQDLPSPADVLDGKESFRHESTRLDRTEAVLSACAALVAPPKAEKRHERSVELWKLIDKITDDAKDVVIPAMTTLVQAQLQKGEHARPVLAKLHSVVTAAGMVGGRR